MKWEVVMEDNPRGQPSPMYRGLVALVSCSPSIAVVTTDGSTVESDQWENVARLIARAPEQAARIAAIESESAQYREAAEKAREECERLRGESAEAFADWCDSRQPAFQAESLYGDVVAMCDLVDRFRAALAAGEG